MTPSPLEMLRQDVVITLAKKRFGVSLDRELTGELLGQSRSIAEVLRLVNRGSHLNLLERKLKFFEKPPTSLKELVLRLPLLNPTENGTPPGGRPSTSSLPHLNLRGPSRPPSSKPSSRWSVFLQYSLLPFKMVITAWSFLFRSLVWIFKIFIILLATPLFRLSMWMLDGLVNLVIRLSGHTPQKNILFHGFVRMLNLYLTVKEVFNRYCRDPVKALLRFLYRLTTKVTLTGRAGKQAIDL